MITKLNGINIAEGVASMAPIDPEYLLAENPDIIIIAGQYWPESKDSMILGYATNLTESRKRLQGFCTRSGWNTLNAVKNNNIHGIIKVLVIIYIILREFRHLLNGCIQRNLLI